MTGVGSLYFSVLLSLSSLLGCCEHLAGLLMASQAFSLDRPPDLTHAGPASWAVDHLVAAHAPFSGAYAVRLRANDVGCHIFGGR